MSLVVALQQHVETIQRSATGSAAGGGPAWDGLLRHYGIAPLAHEERQMIVHHMRLARGAAPAEVRMAFVGLAQWAEDEAKRTGVFPDTLPGLVDREMAIYERSIGVAPPAPVQAPGMPGLGSIFANAQSTSKEVPWAGLQYKQVGSLNCVHCGGPQEQPADFMCRYCRRPIAGK